MTQHKPSIPGRPASSVRTAAPAKPVHQQHQRNSNRANIANLAARLIAEGLTDYHSAKLKAARQMGVTDGHALPDNQEIETALRTHFALFARETQPPALSALRETAIRAMRRLEQFSPWLVGAVLNGTANEFSEIELELIGVEAKDFEMYLLNAGVVFELCETPPAKRISPARRQQPAVKYRLEFDQAQVTVALHEHHAARQTAHPRNAIKRDRAQRADAERRFEEEEHKF